MSTAQQAKNGFKTFIVTFVISLFVFGAFYYLISDYSTDEISIENFDDTTAYVDTSGVTETEQAVLGTEETQPAEVAQEAAEPSPFADLAKQDVSDVKPRTVLAGATQSTQSTVPSTGLTSITIGFLASIVLFAFFAYIIFINPRRYALSRFEKGAMK